MGWSHRFCVLEIGAKRNSGLRTGFRVSLPGIHPLFKPKFGVLVSKRFGPPGFLSILPIPNVLPAENFG